MIMLKQKMIICWRISSMGCVMTERNQLNHIINKLAPKHYMTKYDWVEKVIHWELHKRLKFDHADKKEMYKLESIQENEMP